MPTETIVCFDDFQLRLAERQLLIAGVAIKIGPRAFDVLVALVANRDRMVGKNELFDLVWPGLVVEENNLQVQISNLRKVLGARAIATIPGRGYRFTAAVHAAADASPALSAAAAAAAPAAVAPPGNMPSHLPPLVGREESLAALLALVGAHPLVTVFGAAGMGKTVLAQAAAAALREHWPDGVWAIELAPLTDAAQLPQTVAQLLHIRLRAGEPAQDQLLGALQSLQLLLVLDNCEHLVDAAAALAAAIVQRAPGVHLLVTSQELLNLPEEKVFKLGPLALPGADDPIADAGRFGAVQLFSSRARAADPRFELHAGNATAVVDICRHLDGMPLAIELAAARVRLLGVDALRERLGERFRLLTGGARSAMRRHQTLQAAIDWSHALLSQSEQTVLRRLGCFVGGFRLEGAQRLASDPQLDEWAVLEALSALVDKSLVVADIDEPPRYRLLETTRAYALQRLADAGETVDWRQRHAQVVHDLFVCAEEQRCGEQGALSTAEYVQRLMPELDNARAALDWAAADDGRVAIEVGLCGASAEAFGQLGMVLEALQRMEPLAHRLRRDPAPDLAPAVEADFWTGLVTLGNDGRLPKTLLLQASARAEAICRQHGLQRRVYRSMWARAWTLTQAGRYAEAEAILPQLKAMEDATWPGALRYLRPAVQWAIRGYQKRYEESLAATLESQALLAGVPGEEALLMSCCACMSLTLMRLQRYEEVIALALPLLDAAQYRLSGSYLREALILALTKLGRIEEADQALRQAMPVWRRAGLLYYNADSVALLLAERGRHSDAARVHGAANAYFARSGICNLPQREPDRRRLEQLIAAACRPDDVLRWQLEGEMLDEAGIVALYLRDAEATATG